MYAVLYTCKDIPDLRTIHGGGPASSPVAATVMGQGFPIDEDFAVYVWDPKSTAAHNPPEIVWPTNGSGLTVVSAFDQTVG